MKGAAFTAYCSITGAISGTLFKAISTIRRWSPASRRWRQFLRELSIDPDHLPHPLAHPGDRNFIVCGAPRTGSSLLCATLVQPPAVYTVMEPWDGMRLPPAELFASLRSSLAEEGAFTAGKLDTEALMTSGDVRWSAEGSATVQFDVSKDFMLGIKWPIFWRYLPHLPDTRFIITVRNPYGVISSFRRNGGRLRMGLDYDTAFNARMNEQLRRATSNLARRRVMLFDYIHERIIPFLNLPNVLIVHYERWHSNPTALLAEVSDFLEVDLHRGPAVIRPPAGPDLTKCERALIKRECMTAAAFGYRL